MELLKNRPLCVFCLIFLVSSWLSIHAVYKFKIYVLIAVAIVIILLLVAAFLFRKLRSTITMIMLCVLSLSVALASTAFRMDMPKERALKFVGEHAAEMSIISRESSTEYTSEYIVRIDGIDESRVSIRSLLVLGFSADFSVGDTLYVYADIMDMDATALGMSGGQRIRDREVVLMSVVYEPDDGFVERFDRNSSFFEKLITKDGRNVLLDELKQGLSDRIDVLYDEDSGALVKSFLVGDTSDLSSLITRDFRRSGVSHLFAVSGLHISILIGAVEILLRKLNAHKILRCAVGSVLAFLLLCLTGFAMSAMRSVFMLWIAYVVLLLAEEADSLSVLMASVSIIILILPYSVNDVGLWMSFLATLGLITVYPLAESAIPKISKRKKLKNILLRTLRSALMVAIMTVISSLFLLPIMWLVFGEASIVSVPTNILLSPLNAIYLILSTVSLVLGGIPLIGKIFVFIVGVIGKLTVFIVEIFSRLDSATVSLRYWFAGIIVVVFTIMMITLLLIRLKHKWILCVPPTLLVVSFTVCILVFNYVVEDNVTYYGKGTSEVLSVSCDEDLGIIDMSDGHYSRFSGTLYDAGKYGATDVDTIVLTKVSTIHVSTMDHLLRNVLVDSIYIPMPEEEREIDLSIKLAMIAEECGVHAYLYDSGEVLNICKSASSLIYFTKCVEKTSVSVFISSGEQILGYTDAFADENIINEAVKKCDTVLIGNNGIPKERYKYAVDAEAIVIYSSEEIMNMSYISAKAENIYYNTEKEIVLNFTLH